MVIWIRATGWRQIWVPDIFWRESRRDFWYIESGNFGSEQLCERWYTLVRWQRQGEEQSWVGVGYPDVLIIIPAKSCYYLLVVSFLASTPSPGGNPCFTCFAQHLFSAFLLLNLILYWIKEQPLLFISRASKVGFVQSKCVPSWNTEGDHCFWKPHRHLPTCCSR